MALFLKRTQQLTTNNVVCFKNKLLIKESIVILVVRFKNGSKKTNNGTTAQRHNGTTAQRHNGTTAQRHNGTAAQRHNGTTAQRHNGTTAQLTTLLGSTASFLFFSLNKKTPFLF